MKSLSTMNWFCSQGDNITPPPQALGWVSDLYKDVDEIRSHGQTIIYCGGQRLSYTGTMDRSIRRGPGPGHPAGAL
jgi:hypothetical protein